MENKELLAICLPTYNRDYLIDQELALLCPVAKDYGISIYVSNNASPDKTEEVLAKYQSQYPDVLYFETQKENIGPDANFEYVLKMPSTKYRWLMADASYVTSKELDVVISELQKADYDLYVTGGDGDRVAKFNSEIFTDSSKLMETIGWHMTWISCLIYNQRLIENANFKRYYNSNFIQTGIIFEYFAYNPCNVRFNKDVIVQIIGGEKRDHWTRMIFDIFAHNWYLFVMSLPLSYSYDSKRKCITDPSKHAVVLTPHFLAIWRSKGYWSYKDIIKQKFFVQQTFDYWKLFCMGLTPKFIMKCLLYAYNIPFRAWHLIKRLIRHGK